MTIKELISSDRKLDSCPPHSIFQAESPNEESLLFCTKSFALEPERTHLLSAMPDLLEWEVTKEHFTQEELDEFSHQP